MPKEIIDIIPPEKIGKPKLLPSKKKDLKKPKRKIRFRKLWFFLVSILMIAGFGYGFTFSRVEIEIWPKMDTFELGLEIIVDSKAEEADWSTKIIPGCFLEERNSFSQQFPASGKIVKDEKAEGVIRIYNNYSGLSQSLRANTRFMAASGEVFRTPIRVVIPGKKTEEGKEVPGYIDVKVIADQPGPEYNIKPTSFSIPGLVGTALYTKFYGRSFELMTGGFKGETPQVTKEDLEKAEIAVVKRLKAEGEQILEKKAVDSGSILLKETFEQDVKATSSSAKAGVEVENFDFLAEVKSTVLIFKEEDINKLILDQAPQGTRFYEKSLDINWKSKELNLIQGKITLDLEFSGEVYSDLDQLVLRRELKERPLLEAKEFLEKKSEISKVEIDSWPFWIKKIPRNLNKIKLKLKLD